MVQTHYSHAISPPMLARWLADARLRTLDLIGDLEDEQLLGARLKTINPLLWEIGHLAWFAENWVLRYAEEQPPLWADADSLYDSSRVPHATRWDLSLPSRAKTLQYMREVHERIHDVIERGPNPSETYFILLSIFHEDMHGEAFMYTRQTLGYPRPKLTGPFQDPLRVKKSSPTAVSSFVQIPGGTFQLGSTSDEPFVFDNEKWAHPVELKPFAIAWTPVTQSEFATFVEDGGYRRRELWSEDGWIWREVENVQQPIYWQRHGNAWLRRDFDRWLALEPNRPVIHVNWHEVSAYCNWANQRLPTEAEWEAAAAASSSDLSAVKRRFPWGDELSNGIETTTSAVESSCKAFAQLDGFALGCCDVTDCADDDSYFGCRQMIGNVWEWTASDFQPYPGFVPDPYRDYSQPWFGTHKVLRGGAWVTRARLIRNTWRNFYQPHRRDIWAGFRTCALYR